MTNKEDLVFIKHVLEAINDVKFSIKGLSIVKDISNSPK